MRQQANGLIVSHAETESATNHNTWQNIPTFTVVEVHHHARVGAWCCMKRRFFIIVVVATSNSWAGKKRQSVGGVPWINCPLCAEKQVTVRWHARACLNSCSITPRMGNVVIMFYRVAACAVTYAFLGATKDFGCFNYPHSAFIFLCRFLHTGCDAQRCWSRLPARDIFKLILIAGTLLLGFPLP